MTFEEERQHNNDAIDALSTDDVYFEG